MFELVKYPKSLAAKELDLLLSCGWFRMGQSIFTTEYVFFPPSVYRTIWLRHEVKNYYETKTIKQLKKRNKAFRFEIQKAIITPEHEALFATYKQHIRFETATSLQQLLFGYVYEPTLIYNTFEINLYHEEVLIACSYFDIGHGSAEGIAAYYDPQYTAYSLGRYLIYLQIEYCKQMQFQYYYPGYFVPGFAHLDYKLGIATHCLEFYHLDESCWYPISDYSDVGIPMEFQDYFGVQLE